ncbi:MAG: lipopolysaccharide heptosyltransferase II [Deltaproteobacteria bacterium]|nr:lipopolysaccharide heptosyltransferase II [Deltaproteobacteria bacterium]
MRVDGQETIDRTRIRRILVRATNWVGDMVISLPALEAVRKNFPESTIVVMARPWVIPMLESHPAVDQVLPLRKGRGYFADLIEVIRAAGVIRRMKFDLTILFQNAFEAALLVYLGGVRFRVGYNTDGRGFLLTHTVIRNDKVLKLHQVEYYLSILRAMGWEAKTEDPVLSVSKEAMESVQALLLPEGIGRGDLLLGLSPGAIFGPAKRWPPERFAAIGDRAAEKWRAKVVVMGSPGEKEICRSVTGSMKHTPLDLCGRTTLEQAMALIKRCQFFVTNDSGLMHVAAALDVPMVAIFGSTDHVATGPRSPKARVVRHQVDCAPCLKPECPEDYQCMLGIEPDHVWNEMESLREELK